MLVLYNHDNDNALVGENLDIFVQQNWSLFSAGMEILLLRFELFIYLFSREFITTICSIHDLCTQSYYMSFENEMIR